MNKSGELPADEDLETILIPNGISDGIETRTEPESSPVAVVSHSIVDPATLAALASLERVVEARTTEILETIDRKLDVDRFKEEQISRLHAELQEYKSDLLAKAVRPILTSIIRLHDDTGKLGDSWGKRPEVELTVERISKVLDGFRDDLEIILSESGVSPYREPDDLFVPARQTALKTVETSEADFVGKVAERLRPGFEQGTAVLQKERVAVYVVFREATGAAPAGDTNESQGQEDSAI